MANILIVDDSKDLRECFSALLSFKNYTVETASSGSTLNDAIISFRPDLVLMDVKLRTENGRNLCSHLKQSSGTSAIPVILISANPELLNDYQQCSADDVLEKPFDMNTLCEKIEKLIHSKRDDVIN